MKAYENHEQRMTLVFRLLQDGGFPDLEPCLVVLGSTALEVQGLFLPVPQQNFLVKLGLSQSA